jgi:LysR family nitrogen assimilation transcriptional regulator
MDFQDVNAFAQVARLGSFSRAAANLRVAQSALSRRVLRLEHSLGVDLFERHGRGVRVTRAGEILLGEAGSLLDNLKRIERLIAEESGTPTGVLRLAFPPTTGQVLGPIIVAQCRQMFPRLELQLREGFSGSIHHWIEQCEIDLAILYDPEASSQYAVTPLLKEPLYLIAPTSPPEGSNLPAIGDEFAIRNLGSLPLILPGRAHSIRALVERYAAEHGFRLQIATQVDGIRTTIGLIEAGLGFTIYSYAGVYEGVQAGTLRAIPLQPRLRWTLAVAHRHDLSPSLFAGVRDIIERQINTLTERGWWHGNRLTA